MSANPVRIYAEEDFRMPYRLAKFLREQIAAHSQTVLDGNLTSENYKQFTGIIRGLQIALDEADRLTKELSN